MRLALVSEQPGHNSELITAARQAGWEVVCDLGFAQLAGERVRLQAHAAVLVVRQVTGPVLAAIHDLNDRHPLPVVLYTDDARQQSIRAAVSGGVAAYVANCNKVNRIGALLEIALIRFTELRQLRCELHKARTSLAERNTVEKAKGIIMRQRRLSEDAAYHLLRKLAMDRNRRIGEVANEIIAVADVLI